MGFRNEWNPIRTRKMHMTSVLSKQQVPRSFLCRMRVCVYIYDMNNYLKLISAQVEWWLNPTVVCMWTQDCNTL